MENKRLTFIVNKENKNKVIADILKVLFPIYSNSNSSKNNKRVNGCHTNMMMVKDFLLNIKTETYTVILEYFHINKNFRDSYYTYFSNKHFSIDRYCIRVSLFVDEINLSYFLKNDLQNELKQKIIGFFVISPLDIKHVVKAIVKPEFIIENIAYIRLSEYTIHIYGVEFKIKAFPYQMQDNETTRCAEVTLLNIIDYYSNTYKEYKNVVPSDIIDLEKKHCHERVLPSRGITYSVLTKILYDLGFSPRLYNLKTMRGNDLSGIKRSEELKRILYYYIESGIIAAINVEPYYYNSSGHSLLCIGHSIKKNINNGIEKGLIVNTKINENQRKFYVVDSADFYNEFVVMDDNQFLYKIRDFSNLSLYEYMRVSNITIPLYKRMFLEAADAHDIVMNIIQDQKYGVFNRASEYLEYKENVIIIRLFLASARSYKKFKVTENTDQSLEFKMFYASILLLPQFIWVCELYTLDGYKNDINKAFGEIIIDATTATKNGIQGVISLNYPSGINFRLPNDQMSQLDNNFYTYDNWKEFDGYSRNLNKIEPYNKS